MPSNSMLESFFDLKKRKSSLGQETRGAFTTFLTMSYILVVNPAILKSAGIPFDSAVACTALAAGIACLVMGLVANAPIALASGMGLNSFVAFQVTQATGNWQTAMGLVMVNGLLIFILVLTGLREAVMNAIPRELKLAISAGIGLFIAFIGLVNAKLVVVPPGTLFVLGKNPQGTMPPVTFGSLATAETAVAAIGVIVTGILIARKVSGAILLGIVASTIVGTFFGLTQWPSSFAAPNFEIAFQADFMGALKLSYVPLIIAIMLVDFFDTLGTVTAISESANLTDNRGSVPKLKKILAIDSLAAALGGWFGVSSVTSYIESAAGVAEGARTGLHTVLVGLLFLASILLAPLLVIVPSAATSPALILVGFLMCTHITEIDFTKPSAAIPAFITVLFIPLTYSISHGIGYGFITYVLLQIGSGKAKQLSPLLYIISAIFLAYFVWG